ncbi:prepilin-type cleavage/methylation domain-containing protein [Pseudoalteromonas rubra]|uniref:Prepilin-type cleavage/methylation domain-containing protein n=1 Tax=Pseudoalteromonas rubra TaxID=43658 RepID=A0A4Q7EMQ3_9GAMM|nr:type IV pilin protein [Pseudoalteromonas rubra]RZM85227.1 prepilin-type cleavage/methylation domain-containing protein [Pseudoalteromonas rubra]
MKRTKHTEQGFTLVEMMITIAILGILASIAYPSYSEYVRRAARAEAAATLLDAANKQEQYFVDNRQYASTLAELGLPTTTENDYFSLQIALGDDLNSFVVTATATGGPLADDTECTTLTINNLNIRGSTGTLAADRCWGR